jgi:hypothetical protein
MMMARALKQLLVYQTSELALLAICSLEAGNKQGRVDVAQSIYI